MKTEFVIATKKRYYIGPNGKPMKEIEPKILRKDIVIKRSDVELINNDTDRNGVFYVVDEAETKKYYKDSEKVMEDRKAKADLESALDATKIKAAAESVIKRTTKEE